MAQEREPVLVVGAGALGSVVGGLLATAGWPVTLLGRPEHMEAVRQGGLAIDGIFGSHRVHACRVATSPSELDGRFATMLVTVKSWDTRAAVETAAPHLAPDGWAIGMQNGLGNLETIASVVGPERTLGARVIFGAEMAEPGRVRVTVIADPVTVGALPGAGERAVAAARAWAEWLAAAGVPARFTEDVEADLWAKVLYTAALNPLGALLGVPYGYLAEHEETRAVMDAVLDEAFAVAAGAGVRLPWANADAYRETFYGRLVPSTARHRSSMLQDLERGRPTEIDAINGWVAAFGDRLGVGAPVNHTLARLIRARVRRMREGEPS